jgi:hypothetical protein
LASFALIASITVKEWYPVRHGANGITRLDLGAAGPDYLAAMDRGHQLEFRPFCFLLLLSGVALSLISLGACNRSAKDANEAPAPPDVSFGTKITFGQDGNSGPYKTAGWSKTEEKFTWSEGTFAELRFSIPSTDDAIALTMRLAALVKPPELPFQPVEVYANDQKIAEWQVSDTALLTASIPHNITKLGGPLTISFKTPKATSPKALGLSADPRVLGICCFDLELSKG